MAFGGQKEVWPSSKMQDASLNNKAIFFFVQVKINFIKSGYQKGAQKYTWCCTHGAIFKDKVIPKKSIISLFKDKLNH